MQWEYESKNNNGTKLKNCYKTNRKSLSTYSLKLNVPIIINYFYNSSNKISTTWKIVRNETGGTNTNEGITTISVNGNIIDNPHLILDSFNNNFLFIDDKI
jgi:uncharacterized protein with beta-barrel porin domain